MTAPHWVKVLAAADLSAERPRTIKTHGKQIALFRIAGARGDDEIHAIDNRCPHEGYPLAAGMLKEGILTCEWHNWKFRLCDGVCILGGEDVHHYPLKVEDGDIWLNMAEAPATERFPRWYQGLEQAFHEANWGQVARTVERLLQAGESPRRILGFGCTWGALHGAYGFDHGLAAAADLGALLDGGEAAPGLLVTEALSLIVEPDVRRPERARAAPETVALPQDEHAPAWRELEHTLRRRVEDEDLAGAEALVRGAIAAGIEPDRLFTWLSHVATDHFLGYGHGHIYCVKAEELLSVLGWEYADAIASSLVAAFVYDTREDRLPYMREYGKQMAQYQGRLAAWAELAKEADAAPDVDAVTSSVLDGSLSEALASIARELDRGVAPHRIALVLSVAAAARMLRFDRALEESDEVSEGWLSITHALTHADAVRETLLRRSPTAETLRGLFYSARFVQHLAVCDVADARGSAAGAALRAGSMPSYDRDISGEEALRTKDPEAAVAWARAAAAKDVSVDALLRRTMLADRGTAPIVVVHQIKVPMAAMRLAAALRADAAFATRDERELPILAAVRFLASPLQERRIARTAYSAQLFVREGKMLTKLRGY